MNHVAHSKPTKLPGIKDMSVPWESGDYRTPPESDQVNCLHLTSILNTLPCSLVVSRDNCRPAALIQTARGMSVAFRQSGHVMISLYCAVSLWGLLHQLLLLTPPISLPQCLFVCLIVIPLLASTPFSLEQVSLSALNHDLCLLEISFLKIYLLPKKFGCNLGLLVRASAS